MLYLDDLVIGEKGLAKLTKVKSLLSGRFEMKDLHKLHYFLGIEVIRTPVGIMISQQHYVLNLIYKFGMTNANLCPLLSIVISSWMPIQLIGNLIYLTITRPNLSYSVRLLSQFMQNP